LQEPQSLTRVNLHSTGQRAWRRCITVAKAPLLTAILVGTIFLPIVDRLQAHDSWISRGQYKNSIGEWCCGEHDCEAPDRVVSNGSGWIVDGDEFISYDEAVPSPDGKLWICRSPDRSRRCVFGPPPNT
jgi:hypothetical protein